MREALSWMLAVVLFGLGVYALHLIPAAVWCGLGWLAVFGAIVGAGLAMVELVLDPAFHRRHERRLRNGAPRRIRR